MQVQKIARRLAMRARQTVCVIAAVAAAAVMAGCGSSASSPGSGGSTGTQSGAGTSSDAARGTPIKVGLITTVQSQAFSFPQVPLAAKLAALAINDKGGVNGHPIQVVFCDDQDTASVAASCAQDLVQQDHVVALVGSVSVEGASIYPFLQRGGVADFGEYTSSVPDFSNPLSFPLIPGVLELSGLSSIVPTGTKRAVLIYDQAGAIAWTFFQAGAKKLGITPIGIQVNGTANANYDPVIAQIIKAKPGVVASTDTAGMTQFLSAMNTEGPDVPIELFSGGITQAVLAASKSVKQTILTTLGLTYSGSTREEFLSEASKYGNSLGFTDTDSLAAINAWLAVRTFASIAKTLPTVTAASFLAALHKQTALETGMTPVLNIAANGPSPDFPRITNTYIYAGKITNGNVIQTSDTPLRLG
jgi:ABC-type branched-subunit amino acid transport system substrate-binding protein